MNFPFGERNGSRAMLLMSLSFYGLLFFLNLISDFTSSYISAASEVVQVICLFPLPHKLCFFCLRCLRSCAGNLFVSAARKLCIFCLRCLRSCAGHWFVSLPQKLCIFCLRCLRSCAGHWFVSLPQKLCR